MARSTGQESRRKSQTTRITETSLRDRLRGNWGIVDVEDSVSAIDQLGEQGLIDRKRVAIRGGSAGGYSTLAGLVTKPTSYATGTSLYGISDLAMLAGDTHKFESRYLERLMGGTIEQIPEVYKERSPVHHADQIAVPLLVCYLVLRVSRGRV